jgi:hypothetical protein
MAGHSGGQRASTGCKLSPPYSINKLLLSARLRKVTSGYDAVMIAAKELPAEWLLVIAACSQEAQEAEMYSGRFAGAWVVKRAGRWVPSLRPLAVRGIVEKVGETTRGGRRAYYRMADIQGVNKALTQLGVLPARQEQ